MDPHDIQRKRVDYRHEREAALSITDKAAAEDRQLTYSEVKAVLKDVKVAKAAASTTDAQSMAWC